MVSKRLFFDINNLGNNLSFRRRKNEAQVKNLNGIRNQVIASLKDLRKTFLMIFYATRLFNSAKVWKVQKS